MKTRHILAGMLLTLRTLRAEGQTHNPEFTIKKVEVRVVNCTYPICNKKDKHGDIALTYAGGKKIQVTKLPKATSEPRAMNPQVSPDKQTVGWIEGEHVKTNTSYFFFGPTKLVIYGQGQVLTTFHGSKHYIERWFFWNNGKQIALLSRGSHGPASDELYDVVTGALVASVQGPNLNKQSPDWARKLGD